METNKSVDNSAAAYKTLIDQSTNGKSFFDRIKAFFKSLMDPSRKVMNLPNLLSLLRVALVPVFFATLIFMRNSPNAKLAVYIPAIIYVLTGITDALDGKIARKYGLVTDFGKFIDPLADKFMVLGSFIAILAKYCLTIRLVNNYRADITFTIILAWLFLIVLFRELAVTSLRLVVAGKAVKVNLAANMMGKLKTVSQMVGTVVFILEPTFKAFSKNHLISYIFIVIIAFTTLYSGINYFLGYLPYIAEKKTAPRESGYLPYIADKTASAESSPALLDSATEKSETEDDTEAESEMETEVKASEEPETEVKSSDEPETEVKSSDEPEA